MGLNEYIKTLDAIYGQEKLRKKAELYLKLYHPDLTDDQCRQLVLYYNVVCQLIETKKST